MPSGRHQTMFAWSRADALWLAMTAIAGIVAQGCATGRCLRVPVSAKISEDTVSVCGSAVADLPDRADLLHHYVQLLRVRGRFAEIERLARQTLERDGDRTDARYFLAYALRKQGRCGEALKQYQAYAAANREDPDVDYAVGLCHQQLGDRRAAIASFQRYLRRERRSEQEPWREKARALISGASSSTTPAPRAVSPLATQTRPKKVPVSPAATPKHAGPSSASGAADCGSHRQAFTTDPFDVSAYDRWAVCASAAGRHGEVIKRMRIALRDNPDFGRAWLHLGQAQSALGQGAAAKAAFSKACSAGVETACGR